MAAVETRWFTKGGKNLVESEVGWVVSPINVALMQSGFVFDQDGPEIFADVSAAEAAGISYVAGGALIGTRSVVLDPASNETRLFGDPVEWLGSTITAAGAVIYANVGAKPLLGYADFGGDLFSIGGIFRFEWPATGVLRTRAL
jgi:hypothetical protein